MKKCSACERRRQKIRELAAKAKEKLFRKASEKMSGIKQTAQDKSAPGVESK